MISSTYFSIKLPPKSLKHKTVKMAVSQKRLILETWFSCYAFIMLWAWILQVQIMTYR